MTPESNAGFNSEDRPADAVGPVTPADVPAGRVAPMRETLGVTLPVDTTAAEKSDAAFSAAQATSLAASEELHGEPGAEATAQRIQPAPSRHITGTSGNDVPHGEKAGEKAGEGSSGEEIPGEDTPKGPSPVAAMLAQLRSRTTGPKGSEDVKRVVTAVIGIAIVLPIVIYGGAIFTLVAVLLALASLRELTVAARESQTHLLPEIAYPGLLWVLAGLLQANHLWNNDYDIRKTMLLAVASLFAIPVILLIYAVMRFGKPRQPSLASVALTQAAVFYTALFAFLPLLRSLPMYGLTIFWAVLLGVWAGDTAAYYAGKNYGKRKLTPLSPGKTVEGIAAGGLIAVVVSLGIVWSAPFHIIDKIVLAILIALFAPLGDLVESFWKREIGVKDMGKILPGHGGVLDRCDSLLFASTAAYFYAIWRIVA